MWVNKLYQKESGFLTEKLDCYNHHNKWYDFLPFVFMNGPIFTASDYYFYWFLLFSSYFKWLL